MKLGVHAKTKLVQLALYVLDDLLLEKLPLLEDLFHAHPADNDTRLTLDDALDDILHMAASGSSWLLASCGTFSTATTTGKENGIFLKGLFVVIGANREDCREG